MSRIDVRKELDRFRKELLDLSLRNILLKYRPSRTRSARIIDEVPDVVFDRLVVRGRPMILRAAGDGDETLGITKAELPRAPRAGSQRLSSHYDDKLQLDLDDDSLDRRAKAMLSLATTEVQETGGSSFYLALGFLEWYASRDSSEALRAPLLLVPCELEKTFDGRRGRYSYSIRYTGGEVLHNVSLAMKLRQEFNLELPEYDAEWSPEVYFAEVQRAVRSEPRWQVRREAVLGFFAFAKLLMYRDLDPENWEQIEKKPLVRALFEGTEKDASSATYAPDYHIDANSGHRDLLLAVDADSSQHSAIIDVVEGKSLVIEGPPGTGKSQTITNIIAATIAAGKTVLFVAEKMAALEVVQKNLQRVGLGAFCLEMHSHKSKPAQVYQSLRDRMDASFSQPNALTAQLAQVQSDREAIDGYLEATSSRVGPRNEPLFQVFWHIAALRASGAELVRASVDTGLTDRQLQDRLGFFDELSAHLSESKEVGAQVWKGFNALRYYSSDKPRVAQALQELAKAAESFEQAGASNGNSAPGWPTLAATANWGDLAERLNPAASTSQLVCSALAGNTAARDIATLCHDIEAAAAAKAGTPELWSLARRSEVTAAAREYMALLELSESARLYRASGLDDVRRAVAELDGLLSAIDRLHSPFDSLEKVQVGRPRNVQEFERCVRAYHCLYDPVIQNRAVVRPELFFPGAAGVLNQALEQNASLAKLAVELERHLLLRDVPANADLAALRRDLRAGGNGVLRWLKGSYRAAYAKSRAFRRSGTKLTPDGLIAVLEALEDFLQAKSAFAANESFRRALGPGFRGTETDWDTLKRELEWGLRAQGCGLSYPTSVQLLKNLDSTPHAPRPEELEYLLGLTRRSLAASLVQPAPDSESRFLTTPFADLSQKASKHRSDLQRLLQLSEIDPAVHFRSVEEANQGFTRILQLQGLQRTLSSSSMGRTLFGPSYDCENTDTGPARQTLSWFDALTNLPLPEPVRRWMLAQDTVNRCAAVRVAVIQAEQAAGTWRAALSELSSFGKVTDAFAGGPGWSAVRVRLQELQTCLTQLLSWANLCRALAHAEELGLSAFLSGVIAGKVEPHVARRNFELTFFETLAKESLEAHPALRRFTRQRIEQVRGKFQSGDKAVLELSRRRIACQAAERVPPVGNARGRVGELTELSLIRNEVQKQRAHCKLRQLMVRAGRAVQALKPCFMMSPLSVAQQLPPGEIEFDLVIMDEASQIRPADALGAIARGRQVVIVGDPKQLPPTSFFDKATAGSDDPDDALIADDAESVLEVALKAYPLARRLRWHYRSQHESLIAFSNERFYDKDLVVFPSPTVDAGRLGVRHHFISGATCAGGKNVLEAEAVAKAIIAHAQSSSHESLGVGAFNAEQRDLIQECLDRACISSPTVRVAVEKLQARDEGLFIKSLENLQRDERDVIFVSYTYGPDSASGVVRNNFGPINGDQGWRRLNVLITRARRRLEVFSSLHPEQINAEPGKSRGVHAMRDFLEFSRSGKIVDRGIRTTRGPDSPFEEAVGRVLNTLGVSFVPQVGVAGYFVDIGVLAPGSQHDFVLGIECDGATYHSARSARDRDRLREEVIIRRGWKVHRIWSTDWFLNQSTEELRLQEAVRKALREWKTAAS